MTLSRSIALAVSILAVAALEGGTRRIPSSGVVHGSLARKLDAQLSRMVAKGFSGAVLVARRGDVVLANGYGMSDREKATPVTTDTAFPVGSVTKQFTGAAILKLEMQGKLRVEDRIGRFFRDVPPDKEDITIHELLTHTSGFPTSVGRCQESTTRDEFVRMALGLKLGSTPGTRYEYSNAGYELLAAVVDVASGRPYERYLHDELLEPAGMRETGAFLPAWKPDQVSVGYRDGKRWGTFFEKIYDLDLPLTKPNGFVWCAEGAGGVLSTVSDLYRWERAIEGDRVLSADARQKYVAPHVVEGEGATSHYGYGWAIFTTDRGTKLIAHDGNVNDVFEAEFRRYVDEQTTLILLSNSLSADVGAQAISRQIEASLF